MKSRHYFSMVELLVVMVIMAILAGLIFGAVTRGKSKAQETQARSDIHSIITALKSVESTYHKIVNPGNGYVPSENTSSNDKYVEFNNSNLSNYDMFIVELTSPNMTGSGFSASNINFNTRRIKFLDPKNGFDPTQSVTNNSDYLWKDPWGMPYNIRINTNHTGMLANPTNTNRKIQSSIIVWSWGPNQTNDSGKNTSEGTGTGNEDDIVSWSTSL